MRSFNLFCLLTLGSGLTIGCTRQQTADYAVVDETYVHKYGAQLPSHDWRARGESGQVISTLSNGITVCKNYEYGILNGQTTYTFPYRNDLERIENYSNNKLSQEMIFYASGAPKKQTDFHKDGSKRIVMWYDNGAPQNIEEYDHSGMFVRGESYDLEHNLEAWVDGREGMRVSRDPYGQLIERDTVQKGLMVSRTTYHLNGAPKEVIPYTDSIIDGTLKTFYPDGEPDSIEIWSKGKQHGIATVYQNGEKSAEIPYEEGLKHGIEKHYLSGAAVVEEVTWRKGIKHGRSTSYIGQKTMNQWFFQGSPVSQGNYEILSRSPNL